MNYLGRQFSDRDLVVVCQQHGPLKTVAKLPHIARPRICTQSFDDRLTLGSGGDQIDLYWFGPAHTDGDAFVIFPAEKVLLMGDVMAHDLILGFERRDRKRFDRGVEQLELLTETLVRFGLLSLPIIAFMNGFIW